MTVKTPAKVAPTTPSAAATSDWFTVDREGLASLLEKRGREFALYELVQNAWDQDVKRVDVRMERLDAGWVRLTVEDDDPIGFIDLGDAYTVFARSKKRDDAAKRGRFNLGEKLVLSLCRRAEISSTKGTVVFAAEGRYQTETKRAAGSTFIGDIAMTDAQWDEAMAGLRLLLPPAGIVTRVNGEVLPQRVPIKTFRQRLETEIDDKGGVLRKSMRVADVEIHDVAAGEAGHLYEMGIPVAATGSRWHVNVLQKIPLTLDRATVRPTYLSWINTLVAGQLADQITVEDANTAWATEALSNGDVKVEAAAAILAGRFGEKAVAFDMHDREANQRALDQGYTVVPSRSLSAKQWDNVRRARDAGLTTLLPAGQVTPSPVPFTPGGGSPLTVAEPTVEQRQFVAYAQWVHEALVGGSLTVSLIDDRQWRFRAAYGRSAFAGLGSAHLYVNAALEVLRPDTDSLNGLLLHEFAHSMESNHYSEGFHRAICTLGARFRRMPAYTGEAQADPIPTSEGDEVTAVSGCGGTAD